MTEKNDTVHLFPSAAEDAQVRKLTTELADTLKQLHSQLRQLRQLKCRVMIGAITGQGNNAPAKASDWHDLWSEEGLALRLTREHLVGVVSTTPGITV